MGVMVRPTEERLNMNTNTNTNTTEKSEGELRELTATELEKVCGGTCANGAHIKTAILSSGKAREPVGSFGGILIY